MLKWKKNDDNSKQIYFEESVSVLQSILKESFNVKMGDTKDKEKIINQIKEEILSRNPKLIDICFENLLLKHKLSKMEKMLNDVNDTVGAMKYAINGMTGVARRTRSHADNPKKI